MNRINHQKITKSTGVATRIDGNAMRNIIENIDELDYNETTIALAVSVFGLDRKFYDNATFQEFSEYVANMGRTMMDKNQMNAIKLLLKYKKNSINTFFISNTVPINMQHSYTVSPYTNEIQEIKEIVPFTKPINNNDEELRKKRMMEMFNNSVSDGRFV